MDKIEINDRCMLSYPCQHRIKINGKDEGTWDARKIQKWFVDHDQEVPRHFKGPF